MRTGTNTLAAVNGNGNGTLVEVSVTVISAVWQANPGAATMAEMLFGGFDDVTTPGPAVTVAQGEAVSLEQRLNKHGLRRMTNDKTADVTEDAVTDAVGIAKQPGNWDVTNTLGVGLLT